MSKRGVTSGLVGGSTGPFPAAVESGHHVFISLQLPFDSDGRVVDTQVAEQAARTLENVRLHLQVAGMRLDDIVKLTVYLLDLADLPAVDDNLSRAFSAPLPARTAICVTSLPSGAAVGVEAVAARY